MAALLSQYLCTQCPHIRRFLYSDWWQRELLALCEFQVWFHPFLSGSPVSSRSSILTSMHGSGFLCRSLELLPSDTLPSPHLSVFANLASLNPQTCHHKSARPPGSVWVPLPMLSLGNSELYDGTIIDLHSPYTPRDYCPVQSIVQSLKTTVSSNLILVV